MTDDERAIRQLVDTWHAATKTGDTDRVLALMAEDVLFLVAGKQFGKAEFAAQSQKLSDIESRGEVREVIVSGDWAWARTDLWVKMKGQSRKGPTLSVFRRQLDGRWLLYRDANLLAPE